MKGDIFAVLVAASNGFWNYRHQADVAHAYHVLIDHGVKPDNIIVFAYDDIADSDDNPFPGKIYNQPNGVDVYGSFFWNDRVKIWEVRIFNWVYKVEKLTQISLI